MLKLRGTYIEAGRVFAAAHLCELHVENAVDNLKCTCDKTIRRTEVTAAIYLWDSHSVTRQGSEQPWRLAAQIEPAQYRYPEAAWQPSMAA